MALLILVILGGLPRSALARDLTELTLEELMRLEVTSVSRRPERRDEAAAAVTVITGEDIRRSGATSLPETLRMAPGIHVGRVESGSWAVSSRGFSSVNSSKLLVLVDGRSIYTPLFSGVFWDVQDLFLEDVERIEVIRGPGGTIWGANAMNGVINVLTKSARDTHGVHLEGGGGTEEKGFGGFRVGRRFGENFHVRLFGRYVERDAGFASDGREDDDWRLGQLGFRSDWDASPDDVLTFDGRLYQGEVGQVQPSVEIQGRPSPMPPLEADVAGGHWLASWRRRLDDGSSLELRTYYDRTHRDDPTFRDDLDTFDVDFFHRLEPAPRHRLVWGVSYRLMANDFHGKGVARLRSGSANDQLVSGLVEDELALLDGALRLVAGTKLEYNDFSGFEVQPTGRFAWTPAPGRTLWGAVSRAVRVPTRIERDIAIDASPPEEDPVVRLLGNRELDPEDLLALELGGRLQLTRTLFVDLAAFYNVYDSLLTLELGDPFVDDQGRTVVPIRNRNGMRGDAWGFETSLGWEPHPSWRLVTSHSFLDLALDPRPGRLDVNRAERLEDASPQNQVHLRSFADLPAGFALDVLFRYVDNLGTNADTAQDEGTPKYFDVDVRLGWLGPRGIELSLVGHNLVQDHHLEFPGGTEVQRGVYGKAVWRF